MGKKIDIEPGIEDTDFLIMLEEQEEQDREADEEERRDRFEVRKGDV